VFAGSVNRSDYLRDETGGRRFWPIACTQILTAELERDRDQLWAEAAARYRAGSVWWLDTPELNREAQSVQADRYEGDAWDAEVLPWACDRLKVGMDSVSVGEALELCLDKKKSEWTRADEMRVGRCLRSAKWERFRDRKRGMEWRYRPPLSTSTHAVPTSSRNMVESGNTAND
jgi:putative DNA primase/helicase